MNPPADPFNPDPGAPPVPVDVVTPPVPVSHPIVYDEIFIDSDEEDVPDNGNELPGSGCSDDQTVKQENGTKIPEVLTLSSDDEEDNLQATETMSVNGDSHSATVKMEGPSKESICQLINRLIKEKGNHESFEIRTRKIGDDFELCLKDLDNVTEQCLIITQTCDKLAPKETHITGGGIINEKDASLTINEPVQRIVSINAIQRKISKDLIVDPELARVNLGRFHSVTNYPDIDIVQTKTAEELQVIHKLPKTGAIVRRPLNVGDQVFAVSNPRNLAKSHWQAATIIETHKIDRKMNYTVTYEDSFKPCLLLKGHEVAYRQTPTVMLSIKCRVIAQIEITHPGGPKRFYNFSGIIAEVPRRSNAFRYLVFFDNGSVAYVKTDCVFLIAVENMSWLEDVPEDSRPFLRKYFADLPEKALVKYSVGSKDFVLVNDKWVPGKVKQVDCSLVYFHFRSLEKYEWIFRGSPRLKPLSSRLQTDQLNSQGKPRAPRKTTSIFDNRRERPFVQYTRDDGYSSDDDFKRSPNKSGVIVRPRLDPFSQRAEFELFPELFQLPRRLSISGMFTPHRCAITCINRESEVISRYRDINPFAVPVICGWDRQVCSLSAIKKKREIFYIAPCGRRLRNIAEVDKFLKLTDSGLSIDLFTFHPKLRLYSDLNGSRTQGCYYYEPDIAKGTENHSLSVINWVNDDPITPGFEYWPARFPGRNINIELDPHFLMCCDCTDNCRDKTKCECQRLTREASELVRSVSSEYEEDSYRYRRLQNPVTTGIWECNSNCACNQNCANRVVQNGIRVRLQIFRTESKGWGIRCLHDIPPGAFICIYAAEVLNEELADECGSAYGDEYLADLDYIENVERFKDHYEEAVIEDISSSSSSNESGSSSPSEPETDSYRPHGDKKSKVRSRRRSTTSSSGKRMKKEKEKVKRRKLNGKPYRELFSECSAYSLDAKRKGNVGRYFNHSCDPNCYVQNVFIDSHDLRFPWVALFSHKFIPAFTELNWDYNYEIIEGRKLWCHCGAANCRGRLL